MNRNIKFTAVLILCLSAIAIFGQAPKTDFSKLRQINVDNNGNEVQQPKVIEPVVYRLNPEASQAWQSIEEAKVRLREQYTILESQQAALLIGGNVPTGARSHCMNDKGTVICAVPAPEKKS